MFLNLILMLGPHPGRSETLTQVPPQSLALLRFEGAMGELLTHLHLSSFLQSLILDVVGGMEPFHQRVIVLIVEELVPASGLLS